VVGRVIKVEIIFL
jgi:hypothetical protein